MMISHLSQSNVTLMHPLAELKGHDPVDSHSNINFFILFPLRNQWARSKEQLS